MSAARTRALESFLSDGSVSHLETIRKNRMKERSIWGWFLAGVPVSGYKGKTLWSCQCQKGPVFAKASYGAGFFRRNRKKLLNYGENICNSAWIAIV